MKPIYLIENQYSIYPVKRVPKVSSDYQVDNPETKFEKKVFNQYHEAKRYLFREEYALALNAFSELRQLILKTVNPKLPPHPKPPSSSIGVLSDIGILDSLVNKTGDILKATPTLNYRFPNTIFNDKHILPKTISSKINKAQVGGEMQTISYHDKVGTLIDKANLRADNKDWAGAIDLLNNALAEAPNTDKLLRGSLLHDVGVLQEKNSNADNAEASIKQSINLFKSGKSFEDQASAFQSLANLQSRKGNANAAKTTIKSMNKLISDKNLHDIEIRPLVGVTPLLHTAPITARINPTILSRVSTVTPTRRSTTNVGRVASSSTTEIIKPTALFGKKFLNNQNAKVEKKIFIQGDTSNIELAVNTRVNANLNAMYTKRVDSVDFSFVTGFLLNPVQMVAYLPHMYFFVLPYAMGDCLHGLGRFKDAENMYLSTLKYPFINKKTEIINLWIRIADNIIEQADVAYRRAGDNSNNFNKAKNLYEKIVRTNGQLLSNSQLYKDIKFKDVKIRVGKFLQPFSSSFESAFGSSNTTENPLIISKVLEAKNKLIQIKNKLNFFGFSKNYLPPFSFEYLQNTARYFAQQASQIESKYVQFKSTAENEDLRLDQIDQQVEVATQSVILEERGVSEAQAGIDVASETVDYAETRKQNAKESRDNFDDARWELLELESASAWSSAAAVDEDDEIKQTLDVHYYSASKKRRSMVLYDLTKQKTRINHDLQASNLQNAFEDATAYVDVAKEQHDQAQARKLVAEQRLEIAKIQKRHAQENREFLELKEFGASQWYRMSKIMKRLSRRYLDQAIEIAMLAQRAYHAETERRIRPIRYDYLTGRPGGLLGADQLQQNIDHFTFDMVTNIHYKKAPVKQVISLSDRRPVAFNNLTNTGNCKFHTRLRDFDRAYPGMYQCKIKNVELVIVGVSNATSIAGSLRNIGVSKFRNSKGLIKNRMYSADIMPLSQYSFRNDALAFRFDPKDLKLFENHGVATMWELDIRPDANDFDLKDILDIQLVIYYDGFYSASLEQTIKAQLPVSGNGNKTIGLRLLYPDELFYLRNRGEAIIDIDKNLFAASETNIVRKSNRLIIKGDNNFISNLTLRVKSEALNEELNVATNANGVINANAFNTWKNKAVTDKWTISILPEDNNGKLVDGKLPLDLIEDVFIPLNYSFDYRKF